MDELQRRVVANIRELAARRGLALSHLADRAGLARSHFWKVLKGTTSPTLRWIAKIAKTLGAKPLDLFRAMELPKRRRRAVPHEAHERRHG